MPRHGHNIYPGRVLSNYEKRIRWMDKNPASRLLWQAYSNAHTKKLEYTLTREDLVLPPVCPILGIPLFYTKGKRTDNTPSVDRIDPSKGYTKDNIVVVSWKANNLKGNMTLDELSRFYRFYCEGKR